MAALFLPAILYGLGPEVLLDEGHPFLVLAVTFVVLLLLSRLAGLRAVIGHLQFNGGHDGGYVPAPSPSLGIGQGTVGVNLFQSLHPHRIKVPLRTPSIPFTNTH